MYKKWLTSFKIDPASWGPPVIVTNGPAPGRYLTSSGPYVYLRDDGLYGISFFASVWHIVRVSDSFTVDSSLSSTLTGHWSVGSVVVGPLYPKPRDTLIVDGNTWTVFKDVDSPTNLRGLLGLWRLPCVRLEIDVNLCDTVNFLPPVDSTDAYSSPLTAQGTPVSYACRIQTERAAVEEYQGIQFKRTWYWVYMEEAFDEDVPIGALLTATAGEFSGTTFRVLAYENRDRIDELERLLVTVDP